MSPYCKLGFTGLVNLILKIDANPVFKGVNDIDTCSSSSVD